MRIIAFDILTHFLSNFVDEITRKDALDVEFHRLSESLIQYFLVPNFVPENRKQSCLNNFWSRCIWITHASKDR
jgi:hypothetical protein